MSSSAERYARYAEAVNTIVGYPSATMVNAVMAVADAELQEQAQADPLVGRLVACVEPGTGSFVAMGTVADVVRSEGALTFTLTQYDTPETP
ncbi:hypothetical protein [Streptomyces sp. OR43]|uniref:hypothetical protein n=1 Tax=Streptomyces sp. or43 TaxID=2478957 RepID=UPI0011CDED97|nr:hypothetical protein [Streptomyces sp. or43]TXS40093.1 hypothetical protein EAO72_16875 [Streptomyces sp. or43]